MYKTEPLVWWDNLKYKIKKCAIEHSARKTREERKEYYDLQFKLKREYSKAVSGQKTNIDKIHELEQELERFEKHKCDAAILRSKAQWAFEGDKNTSFFFDIVHNERLIISIS
jgi:hypothetical protein